MRQEPFKVSSRVSPAATTFFTYRRASFVAKLAAALAAADMRAVPFPDRLARLESVWSDPDRLLVIGDLQRRDLTDEERAQLADALASLATRSGRLPARDRDKVNRAVSRLIRWLPPERAWGVVEGWFGDRRSFRREVVVRVLRERGVPPALVPALVEEYQATGDRGLLSLISRSPEAAALLDERCLREMLAAPERTVVADRPPLVDDDLRYWRMRVLELLLVGGHRLDEETVFAYPVEFVWAVGRQADAGSLPLLRRVLERNRDNPEFLWWCLWAFDRMGEEVDRDSIRGVARAIVVSAEVDESAS